MILAATFSAAALCAFADRSLAAEITFTGVVDELRAPFNPVHLMIGDTFSGTFFFNSQPCQPGVCGAGSLYSVTVGKFMFSGNSPYLVFLETDPSSGSVVYQVAFLFDEHPNAGPYATVGIEVTLQAGTPNGVIPPLDQFNLNDFGIDLNLPNEPDVPDSVFGHLTSFPTFNLAVPDGGTSMTLLSWGLIGLAVLLRADSKS